MDSLFRKLWSYVARDKSQTLRDRLFRLMCLGFALAGLFVLSPANLLEPGTPALVNAGNIGFGLFALFCFVESRRGRNHIRLFLSVLILALNLVWLYAVYYGGIAGSTNLYFFGVVVLPLVFLEGRWRWFFVGGLLVNFCCLNLIGYGFPGTVNPFSFHAGQALGIISRVATAFLALVWWSGRW